MEMIVLQTDTSAMSASYNVAAAGCAVQHPAI